MRDQDDRGRMERDRNERDISIKGDIMMLGRKLVLKKFSGIHKDDPLRLLEIAERVSERAFPNCPLIRLETTPIVVIEHSVTEVCWNP